MIKKTVFANEKDKKEFIKEFADLISQAYGDVEAIEHLNYLEENPNILKEIRYQIAEDSECCPNCGCDDIRTIQVQGGDYDENWEEDYCVKCDDSF